MEIPSTTRFDMVYKTALKFLYNTPSAKVLLEQGICPYVELPEQTEKIENTIWPVSFGRLLSLELLIPQEEIDPKGNGKQVRKFWKLDRAKAALLIKRAKGRPEKVLSAGTVLDIADQLLRELMPLHKGDLGARIESLMKLIEKWKNEGL